MAWIKPSSTTPSTWATCTSSAEQRGIVGSVMAHERHLEMKFLRVRQLLAGLLFVASTATVAIAHPGSGIVVDRRGYVYFMDTGSGVWVVDPSGKLAHHDGRRFHWMAID